MLHSHFRITVEAKPPEHVDPCKPSPCGPNAICLVKGEIPSCSCMPEFLGPPPNCRPECVSNSECSDPLACINQKCKDPCVEACAPNAECRAISHTPRCSCITGYTGNPNVLCSAIIGTFWFRDETSIDSCILIFWHIFQNINQKNPVLLAYHLPVDRMPFAGNKMELGHVLVSLDTSEIPTKVVDQNARLTPIVHRIKRAFSINVKILVLEHAVWTPSAGWFRMFLIVGAFHLTLETHLFTALQYHLQNQVHIDWPNARYKIVRP